MSMWGAAKCNKPIFERFGYKKCSGQMFPFFYQFSDDLNTYLYKQHTKNCKMHKKQTKNIFFNQNSPPKWIYMFFHLRGALIQILL